MKTPIRTLVELLCTSHSTIISTFQVRVVVVGVDSLQVGMESTVQRRGEAASRESSCLHYAIQIVISGLHYKWMCNRISYA